MLSSLSEDVHIWLPAAIKELAESCDDSSALVTEQKLQVGAWWAVLHVFMQHMGC